VDLNENTQDRILYMCIEDKGCLSQIMRKNIEPRHFSSEVRQKTFKILSEFYTNYGKAPGQDIIDEISVRVVTKKIRKDDELMFYNYIELLYGMPDFSKELVLDRIDAFMKERLVIGLTNRLIKLQDRVEIDPDKALDEIRMVTQEASIVLGGSKVESILQDPPEFLNEKDCVTKFNIEPLDNQLGGGLKRGDYVVIQAYLGGGKSWCVNHLAKMAVLFGYTPLLIPTEMSNYLARIRMKMSMNCWTKDQVFSDPQGAREGMKSIMNRGAEVLLLSEEEKSSHVDDLPSMIEEKEIEFGRKIDLLLFDSADELLPPKGVRYSSARDENTAIHTFLKNYAKDQDVCIVTTAQTQRGGDEIEWMGASNVADNINKAQESNSRDKHKCF